MPPGPSFRIVLLAGVMAAAVMAGFFGALRAEARRTPCPGARYVVTRGAEQIVGAVTPQPAFLTVENGRVALGSCDLVAHAPKVKKNGLTTLSANAATCGTFSKVKFKAAIQIGCEILTGTVKAKKLRPQSFQAEISTCGDGVLDEAAGEACDGSEGCAEGTCDATCRCTVAATTTSTTNPALTTTSTSLPATTSSTSIPRTTTTTSLPATTTTTSLPATTTSTSILQTTTTTSLPATTTTTSLPATTTSTSILPTTTTTSLPATTTTTSLPATTTSTTSTSVLVTTTTTSSTTTTTIGGGAVCPPGGKIDVVTTLVPDQNTFNSAPVAGIQMDITYPNTVSMPGTGFQPVNDPTLPTTLIALLSFDPTPGAINLYDGLISFFDADSAPPFTLKALLNLNSTANLLFNQVVPFERARFTCSPGAALSAASFGCTISSENDFLGRPIPTNQRPACQLTLTAP